MSIVTKVAKMRLNYHATMLDICNVGIDIQTLHRDAMISDMNYEPVLFTTEDLIEAFALKKPLFAINLFNRKVRMRGDKLPMLTLTKGNQMNGASLILHKSIRKKIGDIVGGNINEI